MWETKMDGETRIITNESGLELTISQWDNTKWEYNTLPDTATIASYTYKNLEIVNVHDRQFTLHILSKDSEIDVSWHLPDEFGSWLWEKVREKQP